MRHGRGPATAAGDARSLSPSARAVANEMLAARATATPATVRFLVAIGSALLLEHADAVVLEVHEVNAVAPGRYRDCQVAARGRQLAGALEAIDAHVPNQPEELSVGRITLHAPKPGLRRVEHAVGIEPKVHRVAAASKTFEVVAALLPPLPNRLALAVVE